MGKIINRIRWRERFGREQIVARLRIDRSADVPTVVATDPDGNPIEAAYLTEAGTPVSAVLRAASEAVSRVLSEPLRKDLFRQWTEREFRQLAGQPSLLDRLCTAGEVVLSPLSRCLRALRPPKRGGSSQ